MSSILLPACTLLMAVGFNEGATKMIKFWVQRRRPNFFALCDYSRQANTCTAEYSKVLEAQLSFPSGHTSLSFCTMTILVLYFLPQPRSGLHYSNSLVALMRVLVSFTPWIYSTVVSVSRIVEYWHHPSDIVAGCIVGITVACMTHYSVYNHQHLANGEEGLSPTAFMPLRTHEKKHDSPISPDDETSEV